MSRRRLDTELVRRGLARSREHANDLIRSGRVMVSGGRASKPATQVGTDSPIVVRKAEESGGRSDYASRGGLKLAGALDAFLPVGLSVSGRRCLDAGASTGGFSDVLLRAGASQVVAVDVGYGQLAWGLRNDPRVRVLERTNVRRLTPDLVGGPVDLVVADLSFISLTVVIPTLASLVTPAGDLVLLVKPQFEVGKDQVGRGGVVRSAEKRAEAVRTVAASGLESGLGVREVTASPLLGRSGNAEYFLWLRRDAAPLTPQRIGRLIAGSPSDERVER
jgi:23S rRNA (cytidine1920-2'-O)/16S rRNA (cytidine1409-2'-O)-methyltransferase